MKRSRSISILLLTILILLVNSISFSEGKGNVYVIPIKGEINKATYHFLKNTVDDVLNNNPSAIIFEIDTYGGLIDQAENIKNLIVNIKIPTIAYVNTKAESAGVLITLSCEKVVMSNSSTIGSAETIPNTEKILSMWRSLLRDVAELRGRDSEIVQAMADSDIEVEGINEKGKLINLNSREALEYGIADYIANDYQEILKDFNIDYAKIEEVGEGPEIKIAKFISNPYISTLLLTLGFVGMIIEIFTPGFGLGGTLSIVAFGLFFGGNILSGNSQWTSLILFITGLILLVIEGMVPGFGLPGISGIILVALGVVLAMKSLQSALMSLSVAIIITTVITIFLIKYGHKSPHLEKIVLSSQLKTEKGYTSAKSKADYLGKEGITVSELRPSGIIELNGERIDAISKGEYIEKGSKIEVVKVEGSKIFVRRV
ncbi:NfeD family protein [Anaerosalibacter sp. Marseille-P3206]|uniref:NfeD family protein n=1 Tax=Anaerosalibacter sp. Marseille-P3206 TaxID=1871005 RepID=UPI000984DEEA|nr:nodulation protein NfeD [Anaerosalibacter sp. Marseille-P3206]